MKQAITIGAMLLATALAGRAQVVASHAPTLPNNAVANNGAPSAPPSAASGEMAKFAPVGKPVVKVNGAILTDRDLTREIQTIFPYANIHNGVPKSMEPEMRKGALDMIVFEELLYQEALKQNRTVSGERMKKAEIDFRKQFPTQREYDQVVQIETHGSQAVLKERIRRSLLIEDMLKSEIADKAKVTEAAALVYYKANPKQFTHPELFSIQTISIIPPQNATPDNLEEAKKKAQNAIQQAKATKSYQEFGLLAERISEDDWHVNMGDRKAVEREKLPPPIADAGLKMKPGEVSDLIQLGPAYTLFRLNAHIPAGVTPFDEVKAKLITDLQKSKTDKLRAELDKKLRKAAKIEVL